jgi:hypothetical protein
MERSRWKKERPGAGNERQQDAGQEQLLIFALPELFHDRREKQKPELRKFELRKKIFLLTSFLAFRSSFLIP